MASVSWVTQAVNVRALFLSPLKNLSAFLSEAPVVDLYPVLPGFLFEYFGFSSFSMQIQHYVRK